MGHESYVRHEEVEGSSNRAFGVVFAVVFVAVALVPLLFSHDPHWWALPVAGVFGVLAWLAPSVLTPLNRLWLRFGLLLHRIVSPIVLGIMFFVVITPMGLIMRGVGKDPLRLRRDRSLRTYWIERRPPGPQPESLRDQF